MAAVAVEQAFKKMQQDYAISDVFIKWCLEPTGLGARSIEDFEFAMGAEGDAAALIAAAEVKDNVIQQTSRVRQAWAALRKASNEKEVIKKRGIEDTDMDAILPQPELDKVHDNFWARHRLTFPPDIAPSDLLISRVVKELGKRTLSLREVAKVHTQTHQNKAQRKRAKINADTEILLGEREEAEAVVSVHGYLNRLLTLMLAYAIAGNKKVQGGLPDELKSDQNLVVEVPLDTVMRYYYRAVDRANRVTPRWVALEWLTRKDEEERSMWVDAIRNTGENLGAIIARKMESRESMWEPPEPQQAGESRVQEYKEPAERPRKPKGNGKGNGKAQVGQTAYRMHNGEALCQEYQRGQCNAVNCRKGRHVCGTMRGKGAVCGAAHPAVQCPFRKGS